MNPGSLGQYIGRTGMLAGCLLIGLLPLLASSEDLPPASQVLQQAVQKVHESANLTNAPSCQYEVRSVLQQKDGKGHLIQSTVKHYRIDQVGVRTHKRLLRIEGKNLSEEELEKENQEDKRFRRQFTHAKDEEGATPPAADQPWATAELLNRFSFRTENRETIDGRPTLKLFYQADPAANRGKSVRDRILREIYGQFWLDEEEAELRRLEIILRRPVKVGFFGMLGSLEGFSLVLERRRVSPRLWITASQVIRLDARKLFKPIHYLATETSTNLVISGTHPNP